MPSPATASSVAHQLQPDEPADGSFQNGVNGEGAVQQPDHGQVLQLSAMDGPESTAAARDGNDLIREGKEKAKVIMAASGVPVVDGEGALDAPPTTRPDTDSPPPRHTSPPSRKRSRSGSPILNNPSSHESPHDTHPDSDDDLNLHEYQLKQVIHRDQLYSEALISQEERTIKLLEHKRKEKEYYEALSLQRQQRRIHPGELFGYGYMGYGNGLTESKTARGIQYPAIRKRIGNRRARPLHLSRKDHQTQAEQHEELVPVRLEIDLDRVRVRDTFTWNLHDRVTPTDLFAENLVEDMQVPLELRNVLIQQVNREMQEQIQDYYPHIYFDDKPLDPNLPYWAYKNDEMRILIKLHITIGAHTLVDQFEWEINNPNNDPEEFARQLTRDVGLSGEFTTAIAHSIREQTQLFTKSLYISGHPFDGRQVEDTDIRNQFLPSPINFTIRPLETAVEYQPYLYELNEQEIRSAETSVVKENKQRKRTGTRRGGPPLPDLKERLRTVRTLVVNSVIPGSAETVEESRLLRPPKPTSGRGRRADGPSNIDNSDSSDSEESNVDSPAPSIQVMGGTARTRGIRGAATAAQAAMRATMARSQTPEISSHIHYESRNVSRRSALHEAREESVSEPTSLIVKLRVSPRRFREWLQNPNKPIEPVSKATSTPVMTPKPTPSRSTPGLSSMPPPPSPAMPPRSTPAQAATSADTPSRMSSTPTPTTPAPNASSSQYQYYPDGRVDAPYPQPAGTAKAPPPPAPWLKNALAELQKKNPKDLFEATMRYMIIDQTTLSSVKLEGHPPGAPLPQNAKAQYVPRLRCVDCPGKLYTAGPGQTVENFEVHLKNRLHRTNVEKRVNRVGSR